MTTYEHLIRAYVAAGRTHWEMLDTQKKYAITEAYFSEYWQDLGDAMFPSRAASLTMLHSLTRDTNRADTSDIGMVAAARLMRYVGESRLVKEAFDDAREAQVVREAWAAREPDPDAEIPDELSAFLRPQAF